MLKKDEKKVNYQKLNEGIKVGVNLLKILYFLFALMFIYILTLLLSKWNVFMFIKEILGVLSPLFIGIVVAWLLNPLVTRFENKNVNRVLATVFVYVVLMLITFIVGRITIPSIANQFNDIISSTPSFISYLKAGIDNIFNNISNASGQNLVDIKLQLYDIVNNFGTSITTKIPSLAMGLITGLFKGGVNLVFGFIIGFYMLFDFKDIRTHFISMIPNRYKEDSNNLLDELNNNLKGYINGTLLIMSILFVCQSIGLTLAGMKAPLVFGLFCSITNIIPYVGPYIGGIPTVLVGFSISPLTGILSLCSVLVCQGVESYFLQPVVMGKTMKLHPVTIMIGLLLFGHFFGIIGMIFATPVISIFKTIWSFFDKKYDIMGMLKTE